MQIAVPTFVSTLTICIVFVSVLFLDGPAKYLFTPLALAVVFAMLASYFLSRTLVPTMVSSTCFSPRSRARRLTERVGKASAAARFAGSSDGQRHPRPFEHGFERLRDALCRLPRIGAWIIAASSSLDLRRRWRWFRLGLVPLLGAGFLSRGRCGPVPPARPRPGRHAARGDRGALQRRSSEVIREIIPADEVEHRPRQHRPAQPAASTGLRRQRHDRHGRRRDPRRAQAPAHHSPTPDYMRHAAGSCHRDFPELTFYFPAGDIVSQILNFGLPAPIDIQVAGRRPRRTTCAMATQIAARIAQDPRRGRRAPAPGGQRAQAARRRRSHARQRARPDAAGRRRTALLVSLVRQRPGVAELLGRSEERRHLPRGGADAARTRSTRSTR